MSSNPKLPECLAGITRPRNPIKGEEAVRVLYAESGLPGLAEYINKITGLSVEDKIKALIDNGGSIAELEIFQKAIHRDATDRAKEKDKESPLTETDTKNIKAIVEKIKDVQVDAYISKIKKNSDLNIDEIINELVAINGQVALEKYKAMQTELKGLLDQEWLGSDQKMLYEQYEKLHATIEANVKTIEDLEEKVAAESQKVGTLDIGFIDRFVDKVKGVEPSVEAPANTPAGVPEPSAPPEPPAPPPGAPGDSEGQSGGPPAPPPGLPGDSEGSPAPPGEPSIGRTSTTSGGWFGHKKEKDAGGSTSSSSAPKNAASAASASATSQPGGSFIDQLKSKQGSPSDAPKEKRVTDIRSEAQKKRDQQEKDDEEEEKKDKMEEDNAGFDSTSEQETRWKERAVERGERKRARDAAKAQEKAEHNQKEAERKRLADAKKAAEVLETTKAEVKGLQKDNKNSIAQIKKAKSYTPDVIQKQQSLKAQQDEIIRTLESQKERVAASLKQNQSAQESLKSLIEVTEEVLESGNATPDPSIPVPGGSEPPEPPSPPGPPEPPGPPDVPGPPGEPSIGGTSITLGGWRPPAKTGATKKVPSEQASNTLAGKQEKGPAMDIAGMQEKKLEMDIIKGLEKMIGDETSFSTSLKKKLGKASVETMIRKIIDVAIEKAEKQATEIAAAIESLEAQKKEIDPTQVATKRLQADTEKKLAAEKQKQVKNINDLLQLRDVKLKSIDLEDDLLTLQRAQAISPDNIKQGITGFYNGLPDAKKQELKVLYTTEKKETDDSVKKDTKYLENHTPENKEKRRDKLKDFGLENLESEGATKTDVNAEVTKMTEATTKLKEGATTRDDNFKKNLDAEQAKVAEKIQAGMTKLEENAPPPKADVKLPEGLIKKRDEALAKVKENIEAIKPSTAAVSAAKTEVQPPPKATESPAATAAEPPKVVEPKPTTHLPPVTTRPPSTTTAATSMTTPNVDKTEEASKEEPPKKPEEPVKTEAAADAENPKGANPEEEAKKPKVVTPPKVETQPPMTQSATLDNLTQAMKDQQQTGGGSQEPASDPMPLHAYTAHKENLAEPASSLGNKSVEVTPEKWFEIKAKVKAKNPDERMTSHDGDKKITLENAKIDIENKETEVKVSSKDPKVKVEVLVANYKITAKVLGQTECAIGKSPSAEVTAKLITALNEDPPIKPILSGKVLEQLEKSEDEECKKALTLYRDFDENHPEFAIKPAPVKTFGPGAMGG